MNQFSSKNFFCFLIWQVLVLTVAGLYYQPHYNKTEIVNEYEEQVKLRNKRDAFTPITIKIDDDGKLMKITLQPTNQRLANKFVPVWHASRVKVNQNEKIKYRKQELDMSRLGEITMYRNVKFHAAIVHFRKTGLLQGVIGNRIYLENLPVKKLKLVHKVGEQYVKKRNLEACKYPTFGRVHNLSKKKNLKKHSDRPESPIHFPTSSTLYPELMIMIDHDVLKNIEGDHIQPETGFLKTLSYIVTYFNAVDMIYSKLSNPTVELNIAGIIIEVEPQTFTFLHNNRQDQDEKMSYRVDRVLDDMVNYFESSESGVFRCGTSDTTILFIGHDMYTADQKVWGLAYSSDELYDAQLDGYCPAHYLPAVIRFQDNYESYPVTAHEIGHTFTLEHDAEVQSDPLACDKNIMHEFETCPDCLEWSQQSIEAFRKYFSSKQHCILINYPRSLSDNYAKRLVTRNELCHCYGQPYAIGNSPDMDFDCARYLNCADDNDYSTHPVPMDGTSCGRDRVCWDKKCVKAKPFVPALDKMEDKLICV